MKLKNLDPHSPEVISAAVEMIRRMTPEEALAFLTYKTPGIEETDMTGLFPIHPKPPEICGIEAASIAAKTERKPSRQAKRKSRVPTLS